MLDKRLRAVAAADPAQEAIVCGQQRISYQQLVERIDCLSECLKCLGVSTGDCVVLLMPNCPEFVISFFALARIKAIALPLNHLFQPEEIIYYLRDSQAKAIICDAARAEICQPVWKELEREIPLIITDQKTPESLPFADLCLTNPELASTSDAEFTGDVLYQYSSGSTGRPKRVARTQNNLYCELTSFAQTTKVTSHDKILCVVPLYHAHGLGNGMLAAICNGATLVLLEQAYRDGIPVEVPLVFKSPQIFSLIKSEQITIFPAVPYIFNTLAETPFKNVDLSSLRLCFSAGNFLSQEIFEKFLTKFGVPIRQLYGCTEAGAIAINLDDDIAGTYNSVGQPLAGIVVKVIDESGKELRSREVGELLIVADTLTKEYYNLPQLNQQAFKYGGFLTGDLGYIDERGRIFVTGRKKILIDTGGRKVDPIEVEDILLAHSKVKEAVVVGVKGGTAGEMVKAVVVRQTNQDCQEQEIFNHCKDYLAAFKVPKIIEFREEIPKSPLGKILRKELV